MYFAYYIYIYKYICRKNRSPQSVPVPLCQTVPARVPKKRMKKK